MNNWLKQMKAIIDMPIPRKSKPMQLELFYEKGNGYYSYWNRIYSYHYDNHIRCRHCMP